MSPGIGGVCAVRGSSLAGRQPVAAPLFDQTVPRSVAVWAVCKMCATAGTYTTRPVAKAGMSKTMPGNKAGVVAYPWQAAGVCGGVARQWRAHTATAGREGRCTQVKGVVHGICTARYRQRWCASCAGKVWGGGQPRGSGNISCIIPLKYTRWWWAVIQVPHWSWWSVNVAGAEGVRRYKRGRWHGWERTSIQTQVGSGVRGGSGLAAERVYPNCPPAYVHLLQMAPAAPHPLCPGITTEQVGGGEGKGECSGRRHWLETVKRTIIRLIVAATRAGQHWPEGDPGIHRGAKVLHVRFTMV